MKPDRATSQPQAKAATSVDPLVDVSTWATTRRAGLCTNASVKLTRSVWEAIERVPLETVASSDVVQRLHVVLCGAARAIADACPRVSSGRFGARRVIPFVAPLQTQIDGPALFDFIATLESHEGGSSHLTIDCGHHSGH